jgi:hypothetical protein
MAMKQCGQLGSPPSNAAWHSGIDVYECEEDMDKIGRIDENVQVRNRSDQSGSINFQQSAT